MQVILLNGPPSTGKDTAARAITEALNNTVPTVLNLKMAQPLRDALCALIGITDDEVEEAKRSDPRVRQVMIDLSERVIKPRYGKGHFARVAFEKVKALAHFFDEDVGVVIISDAGFQYEVEEFLDLLRDYWPEAESLTIRTHRDGYGFKGDSRSYIDIRGPQDRTADVYANTPQLVEQLAVKEALDFLDLGEINGP